MSATLRVEDFTENRYLFPVAPPVVKVVIFEIIGIECTFVTFVHIVKGALQMQSDDENSFDIGRISIY